MPQGHSLQSEGSLHVSAEVRRALRAGKAVVALESNLICHGLPRPDNLEIARKMESVIRDEGAVPATIAILQGQIIVGVSEAQLEYLATANDLRKCSVGEISIAVGLGESGGTTVAATMYIAWCAGIRIFATAGIGGVHRGQPFDVSTDLTELRRTPVTVICSGAKSILDLPLTREVLETYGVPVIGYASDDLAAYYSRSSGLPVDVRCDTPAQIASIMRARDDLHLSNGLLVSVPVPIESELDANQAEQAIIQAVADAEATGIKGKAITPFVLNRVSELTGGESLRANESILVNNARVAARVALAWTDLASDANRVAH